MNNFNFTINEVIEALSFTREEYKKVADFNGAAEFDIFIKNVVSITLENNGTLEDAIYIAENAIKNL